MLAVENITKKFSGVTALNRVSLSLEPGKVTAIIGENGAGKSTLMKILSGVYHDYEGRVLLHGEPIAFENPKDAQEKGIVIIHQELNLLPYLTITENIFLGRERMNKLGFLDKKAMRARATELLHKLRLDLDPDTRLSELKVGQQQVVEIAKALLIEAEVVIMDEPTSAISEKEVAVLFEIIEELKREGKTIVYISHKLDELFRIADRYIVMRDGCMIESGDMKEVRHDSLIQKMVGREVKLVVKDHQQHDLTKPLLSVRRLGLQHAERNREPLLKNLSFDLAAGEILGVFGLMGAGRTELLECLFGLHPKRSSGSVTIDDQEYRLKSPQRAINAGLALVPEDRKKDGLILNMAVRKNLSLTTLDEISQGGFLRTSKERALSDKYIGELQIKTASDQLAARNLSGGNQQKIVIAKWLATHPKILLLDEPTRGIDIHAKNEIYKLIVNAARQGLGIIMVSSELPEILAVSDRVLVLAEGRLTAGFTAHEATEDKILKAAIPKTI